MDAMTLRDFFEQYYKPRKLIGCSQQTPKKYYVVFNNLRTMLRREPKLSDLTEDVVAEYTAWMAKDRRPDTVRTNQKKLLALAGYAVKKGLLKEVPDAPKIKLPTIIKTSYTPEEIGRLIEAAKKTTGYVGDIPSSLFWPALFLTAYDTGARKGALFALRWQDFRPEVPALLFRAETQKQHADQLLKVSSETAAALAAIHRPDSKEIFAFPYNDATIYNRIHRIFKAAKLPHGRRDLLHRIRRTTATLTHNNGGDACSQLGHSTDAVTRKHYLDTTNAVQAVDVMPRPGEAKEPNRPAQHNPMAEELRRQARELLAMAEKLEAAA